MRIGVVGINHKLADLKLRDQLAKTCQRRFGASQSFHDSHYFVLLSTCNRTEIYFSSHDLTSTHSYLLNILRSGIEEEFDHKLYSYFGPDCFCHLARVTAGLDSAILAETEIQGQVKIAYEKVITYHHLPKDLHFLFQKSLGIAKNIRAELQLGRGMPQLEHAILQVGNQFFSCPNACKVLFVGASGINQKVFKFLKTKNFTNITLCNRTDNQSKQWSQEFGLHFLAWQNLNHWKNYDWIILGTKSPNYLLNWHAEEKLTSSHLIMDLSVPRNADPKLSHYPEITLLNIDQLNRSLKSRHRSIAHTILEAEQRIAETTQQHVKRYTLKEQAQNSLLLITA